MEWLNYAVLLLYILMMAAIAYFTRNRSNTADDFILAGRGIGGWMTAFAYGTTYFSAVIFIGYAGKFGWNFGLAAVWVGLANAILGSLLPWLLLARRTRNLTNKLNVNTMPGFFEKRYLDSRLKLIAAVIIFIFLIPYSASVYQGLGYVFEMVFGINFIWCIVIMAALTGLYIFFGGYIATAVSNFIQGIIMLAGTVIMVAIFLSRPEVNFLEGLKELASKNLGLIPSGEGAVIASPLFNVIIIVLLTSIGVWALPQVIHKFYAVKNEGAIKRAIIISTVFALVVGGGAYFIGSLSRLFLDAVPLDAMNKPNMDLIIPTLLDEVMPDGLMGLILVLLLSASMSTLASLAITSSSAVVVDVYKGYVKKDASEKTVSMMLRIVSLLYVVISAVLAIFNVDAIVTMMSLSWGTLAGCFIGPYIYGLYSKKATAASVWISLISGVVITLVLVVVFGLIWPAANLTGVAAVIKGGIGKSPLIGVIVMASSLVITPIVSCFTKKPDAAAVEEMFNGINKKLD